MKILMPQGVVDLANFFCGCATKENTWMVVEERLANKEYQPNDDILTAVLDYFNLTDHGTSIRGAWLTEKGEQTLKFLQDYPDWFGDEKNDYVDSEGIHYGMV